MNSNDAVVSKIIKQKLKRNVFPVFKILIKFKKKQLKFVGIEYCLSFIDKRVDKFSC